MLARPPPPLPPDLMLEDLLTELPPWAESSSEFKDKLEPRKATSVARVDLIKIKDPLGYGDSYLAPLTIRYQGF